MSALSPDQFNSIRNRLIEIQNPISISSVIDVLRETLPATSPIELINSADQILANTVGFGPIEQLINRSGVTDVLVNGHLDIWFDQGSGLQKSNQSWQSEIQLREFATRLANSVNRRLDDASPFVDAKLENGIRFHAVIPPLSNSGTLLSFRIPSEKPFRLTDLVTTKTISENIAELLRKLIHQRISFVISGSTGSGKTTILGALLSEVNEAERILIIEDSAELKVTHPHVLTLQTRNENAEGIGNVELKQLVKQALRMRPDRLVIGEVRGIEVLDLLVALNTGHEGSCVTIHANNTEAVIARIEALGLLAKVPKVAIQALLKQALQVLIHVQRTPSGRKVTEISVIGQNLNGELCVHMALDLIHQQKFEPGWQKLQKLINQ